ncbi:hypothetical protein MRB53_016617 [Persea americana]|uniref:Uncharacterized protein n=1 Tax=Persea americana TaxID=3435 RepID=A0ACC2M2N2_PERAE|nr:hypothetical protein MRB53_016617 [Persea americana]
MGEGRGSLNDREQGVQAPTTALAFPFRTHDQWCQNVHIIPGPGLQSRTGPIRFPAELHLVHRSDDGDIILYRFGDIDPFLIQLKDCLSQLAKEACAGDEDPQVPLGILRTKVSHDQLAHSWQLSAQT